MNSFQNISNWNYSFQGQNCVFRMFSSGSNRIFSLAILECFICRNSPEPSQAASKCTQIFVATKKKTRNGMGARIANAFGLLRVAISTFPFHMHYRDSCAISTLVVAGLPACVCVYVFVFAWRRGCPWNWRADIRIVGLSIESRCKRRCQTSKLRIRVSSIESYTRNQTCENFSIHIFIFGRTYPFTQWDGSWCVDDSWKKSTARVKKKKSSIISATY